MQRTSNKRGQALVISLEFSKVFDWMSHYWLVERLRKIRLSEIPTTRVSHHLCNHDLLDRVNGSL